MDQVKKTIYVFAQPIAVLIVGFFVVSIAPHSPGQVLGIQTTEGRSLLNPLVYKQQRSAHITALQEKPFLATEKPLPEISAQSAIVIDRESKSILYKKDIHQKRYPASTTKIITGTVILENTNVDEIVTVPAVLSNVISGSLMGLSPNEQISRRNLLWGMLMNSGNDAAYTLAITYPGGFSKFMNDANNLIKELNLSHTHIADPTGFVRTDHYTTAFDLAVVTDHALQNEFFQDIVQTQTKTIYSQTSPPTIYTLTNTNTLLGDVEGVKGVKTGWTPAAGGALVTLTERNNHEILVIVLQSEEREQDSKKLIEWVYDVYEW